MQEEVTATGQLIYSCRADKSRSAQSDIAPNSYRHPKGELIALEEDRDVRTFLSVWEKRLNRPVEFVDTSIYPNIRAWPAFGTKKGEAVQ